MGWQGRTVPEREGWGQSPQERGARAGGTLPCCYLLKKGTGGGEEGGEETGARLLKDSMSCAQCIRKVLKTAKAPHQTHTAVKQPSVQWLPCPTHIRSPWNQQHLLCPCPAPAWHGHGGNAPTQAHAHPDL